MLVVYRTADLRLLIVLMRGRVLMLKTSEGIELRRGWLKRTADE